MTSSLHCVGRKEGSFGRIMYPLGFIVIALMLLKLRGVYNVPPSPPSPLAHLRSETQKSPGKIELIATVA